MRHALGIVLLLFAAFGSPRTALAIPLFANGQGGVSCELCHTAVPHLNAYGRYVLMTNFSRGLNPRLQTAEDRAFPVAFEGTVNASSVRDAALPAISNGLSQLLAGGFAGRDVTYFATVPIVAGGFPARGLDQAWVAYDGFAREKGSLQAGRFATPVFAPWVSQPLTLTGYGVLGNLADNRWGASYTYLATPQLIANASYLAGSGDPRTWTASLQYLSTQSHWSGALAAALQRGCATAAALLSYAGNGYEFTALDAAGKNGGGFALEGLYRPVGWADADLRYENDGGSPHYISDIAFSVRPNIVLTLEHVAAPNAKPVLNYQLLWAGPWYRKRFPPHVVPAARAGGSVLSNGRSIYFTLTDANGVRVGAQRGVAYQSCAVCHGPRGSGGVRLPGGAVSATLGPHAHMNDSMGGMRDMPMDWSASQVERAITQGVDNMGQTLDPAMPRWKMSERDLRDLAAYVLSLHPGQASSLSEKP